MILLFYGQNQEAFADFDCNTVTEIPVSECEALVSLYNSTNGGNWANSNGWLIADTPCSWYGIGCLHDHVDGIVLQSNQLTGNIPDELGNLTNLRSLYLQSNQLTGSIPIELMNLTSLVDGYLSICYNHLYTNNSDLRDFLNIKEIGGDWESCQTPLFARPIPCLPLLLVGE